MAVATATETGARPARAGRRPPARLGRHGAVPGVCGGLPAAAHRHRDLERVQGQYRWLDPVQYLGAQHRTGPQRVQGLLELSLISSLIGAVFGAVLAYAVASGNPDGLIRRLYLAGSGVLAQFGGVTLAFAFLATIGPAGFLMHASWYSNFPWGIALIYSYFQIPLMVLVFLPAIDGLKVQWREAAEKLGGSTWHYWRYVGGPLLTPAFLGATLLLFANALSAFATIEAWEDQISYVVPQPIGVSLISEVGLANFHTGDALALGMIVMVVIVMAGYFLLQRRAARWQR